MIKSAELDRRLAIERPVADEAADGAGSGTWELVAQAWAQVRDVLPSRAERLADGFNVASRPARIRMRFRSDITPDMRFVLMRWENGGWVPADRTMQIIAGPAELGRREGVEFMVEDYRSAGNPA